MTAISGGSGPSFRIGSTGPSNYARFANNSTPTWGSALSQLGGAWAAKHTKEQLKKANRALASEQGRKRQSWMQDIGNGATLRDLASADPSVLSDVDFLKFVDATRKPKGFEDVLDDQGRPIAQRGPQGRTFAHPLAPEPEGPAPEMFEDVLNPHGFGGAAQRSSTTGELTGYRAAPSQPQGRERRTATDRTGRLRYTDDSSPVFADSIFDQGETPPEVDAPPLKDRLSMVRDLSSDWQKTTKPMQGLLDSSDRMNIGFDMANAGDMLAGSQAILISFNKLLDPGSVVRESEYARSATGQSALETLRGYATKLAEGGAGVTLAELESYKRFGEEVVRKALESTVAPERERITRLAGFAGVDPELIFTGRFAPPEPDQAQGAPQGLPQAAPQGLPQAAPSRAQVLEDPSSQASGPAPSGFAKLAQALTGGPGPAPARAPAGPRQGPTDLALPQQRVADYGRLSPDALKRQVARMKADRASYSPEELHAAAVAWQKAFGE